MEPRYNPTMYRGITLDQVVETLARCGVSTDVRDLSDDDVTIKSGLCEIGGRKTLIIDKRLNDNQRIHAALDALKTLNLENIFVPPAIRELTGWPGNE